MTTAAQRAYFRPLTGACQRAGRLFASPLALAAILLLAAVLRVEHILALRHLPSFDLLLLDSALYDGWARKIAAGEWLGSARPFYMDPLYPYLLALQYKLFGHNLLVVRLVQAACGVGTCALVAAIGRRVAGWGTGNLAALALAVYAPAIFHEAEIEKTALGVFLLTAALTLAIRRSVAAKWGAGLCLALATLTRGNLLALMPLAMVYFLLDNDSQPVDLRSRLSGPPGRSVLAFLFGILLVFSPVLWRNHHVSGEWVLTTSQAGQNFYTGNNPANSTGCYEIIPFVSPYPAFEEADFRAEAEARSGRLLTSGEISSFWFAESWRHIKQHPGFAATVFLRKFILFCSDVELPDGSDIYFLQRYSPVLRLPLLTFGVLLPFALLGMATSIRGDRRLRLLAGFVVAYCATVVAFFIFSRYRLHVVPALAVFASLGLQRCSGLLHSCEFRRLAMVFVCLVATAIFSFKAAASFGIRQHQWLEAFEDMAMLYEEKGDYHAAGELLREALKQSPDRTPSLCALGRVVQKAGDHLHAVDLLERCLEGDNNYPDAWYLLGRSREALGERQVAAECYRRQLLISPGHRKAGELLNKPGLR